MLQRGGGGLKLAAAVAETPLLYHGLNAKILGGQVQTHTQTNISVRKLVNHGTL